MIYRAQVETAGMAFEWEYEGPAVDLTDPAAEEKLRADIAQDCEEHSALAAMDQGFFVESIEVVR